MPKPTAGKKKLLLILIPLLFTFACQRFYLHVVPIRHITLGDHVIHHLFIGILILIPSSFVIALARNEQAVTSPALVGLGMGSAMVLDEVAYLTFTEATSEDYRSGVSLLGAMVLVTLASFLLMLLYRQFHQSSQAFPPEA
jgi:hypothetical protein